MSRRALIAIALLSSVAHADEPEARWDATDAFGGTLEQNGGDFYSGTLLQIQLGRRITQRIAVSASAELASAVHEIDGEADIEGAIVRGLVGVDLYLRTTDGFCQPALVASVGSGSETIAWDRGTLTRPMSYVGAEYRANVVLGNSGFIRNLSRMGFRFGVRGHIAPGVADTTVAKLCTACEAMNEPKRGVDLGVAIYMGLIFGR